MKLKDVFPSKKRSMYIKDSREHLLSASSTVSVTYLTQLHSDLSHVLLHYNKKYFQMKNKWVRKNYLCVSIIGRRTTISSQNNSRIS